MNILKAFSRKKDTIKPRYNNYNELPISTYHKVKEIAESDLDDITKEVKYISILYGIPEPDIWELSVIEIGNLRKQLQWLNNTDFNQKFEGGEYTINGNTYVIDKKIENVSYSQFVDFQNYYGRKNMEAEILSVFMIPKGKKYGQDYDIDKVINEIMDNVSIADYNAIVYHFFLISLGLSVNMVQYLQAERQMMMIRAKLKKKLQSLKAKTARIVG